MVRAKYYYDEDRVLHEEVVEPYFLLTNKNGGFFLDFHTTKYRGLFTVRKEQNTYDLIKTIDKIGISKVPSDIKITAYSVEKGYGKSKEEFLMHENGLLYEVKEYTGTSTLSMDFREIFSYDPVGNFYTIYEENGCLVIEFTKKKGKDTSYKHYLVIKTDAGYTAIKEWKNRFFEFDQKRKDSPLEWYVFEALNFDIKRNAKVALVSAENKNAGIGEANYLFFNSDKVKESKEARAKKFNSRKEELPARLNAANYYAKKAFNDLIVDSKEGGGIYAGLPWFCQFWSRDESISLTGLLVQKEYDEAKKIIMRYLGELLPDGRISNRFPHSDLGSADGVGWLFLRVREVFDYNKFTNDELMVLKERLRASIERLEKNHILFGLVQNNPHETWMDTGGDADKRDGARIEIQALTLNMYNLMGRLYKKLQDPAYKEFYHKEEEMHKIVKRDFFKNGKLFDGKNDPTIRPNVFLAYYSYPKLLSEKEWALVFKYAIEKLWLDWGGFSTIQKDSPLFQAEYTGSNNLSYHRGDSWFFINNIAAICMYRLNHRMFGYYIKRIVNASTNEVLNYGALATCSELTSSVELRSEGCISQAWSAATYIEMIHEIFN